MRSSAIRRRSCFDKARALAPDDIDVLTNRANALLSSAAPRRRSPRSARFWRACRSTPRRGSTAASRTPRSARSTRPSPSSIDALTLGAGPSGGALQPRRRALRPRPLRRGGRGSRQRACGGARSCRRAGSIAAGRWPRSTASTRPSPATARRMALRKDDADAHFIESLALLTLGDYRRGFEKYEWRWRSEPACRRRAAAAGRCGSAIIRWRARPCCCTPNRVSATPSSSRATCRSSPRPAPRSCSKCSRN